MLLAYTILLPDAAHNRVRELQWALHQAIGPTPSLRLDPHLTLKTPFPATAAEPFAAFQDVLAAEARAFEVRATGVAAFDDGTVYLDIAPDARLAELRHRVLRGLAAHGIRPEKVEGEGYHFHITLARELAPAERAAALSVLAGRDVAVAFVFDTLGLFCSLRAEEWFVYRRSSVGG